MVSKWEQPYQVFETACYPCKWKVGRFEEDDNAVYHYFVTRKEAELEAERRNERDKRKWD